LPSPTVDEPGLGGKRRRKPQVEAARVHPAQRAEGRISEQQVQRRRHSIRRGWPDRTGVGAHNLPSFNRA